MHDILEMMKTSTKTKKETKETSEKDVTRKESKFKQVNISLNEIVKHSVKEKMTLDLNIS